MNDNPVSPINPTNQTPPESERPPANPPANGITPPTYNYMPQQQNDREGLKTIISTIAIIIMAPIIALCLTAFVFQSYEVDGSSMETTLQNQDRLIVYKVPRTVSKITRHPYIPNRGDVIIFNKNDLADFGTTEKRQLVKRVIGLPGDHIVIKDGTITVINAQHPDGFQPDKTLPYSRADTVANSTSCGGSYCDLTVPANDIFVCGDNRGNSLDSRIFGPISSKDIVGKLSARIFPFNKFKVF